MRTEEEIRSMLRQLNQFRKKQLSDFERDTFVWGTLVGRITALAWVLGESPAVVTVEEPSGEKQTREIVNLNLDFEKWTQEPLKAFLEQAGE